MTEITLENLQRALDDAPYQYFLGVRAVAFDIDQGSVTLRLPFKKDLCRSSKRPELHGGVTAALIDIAGDYALALQKGEGIPTIDLRVDYLRMASDTDLVATALVVKSGRTLGVVNVEVHDEQDRLIAVGRGTYYMK